MERQLIYNADINEVYDVLESYYDDELWFDDLEFEQLGLDVMLELPTDVVEDTAIYSILIAEGFDLEVYM